jgi:hypothetical protein
MLWGLFSRKKEERRLLFPYYDGIRTRRADPVAIENVLISHLGHDWSEAVVRLSAPYPPGLLGEVMDQARQQRAEERAKVIKAICEAFDVTYFGMGTAVDSETGEKGAGLGEIELLGLLDGYQRFVIGLLEISRPFVSVQQRASPSHEPPPQPKVSESILAGKESSGPNPEPYLMPS